MTASNKRGAHLAQIALEAYYQDRTGSRRGGLNAADLHWSESDIIDLMTDLLILARQKGYDLSALLTKVEAHIESETGHDC